MIASISSEVATGRWMNRREGFIREHQKEGGGYFCSRLRLRGSPSFPLLPAGVGFELAASGSLILAPSRRRSTPSTTTLSPGANPSRTATCSPLLGPTLIGRTETVESGLAT